MVRICYFIGFKTKTRAEITTEWETLNAKWKEGMKTYYDEILEGFLNYTMKYTKKMEIILIHIMSIVIKENSLNCESN